MPKKLHGIRKMIYRIVSCIECIWKIFFNKNAELKAIKGNRSMLLSERFDRFVSEFRHFEAFNLVNLYGNSEFCIFFFVCCVCLVEMFGMQSKCWNFTFVHIHFGAFEAMKIGRIVFACGKFIYVVQIVSITSKYNVNTDSFLFPLGNCNLLEMFGHLDVTVCMMYRLVHLLNEFLFNLIAGIVSKQFGIWMVNK